LYGADVVHKNDEDSVSMLGSFQGEEVVTVFKGLNISGGTDEASNISVSSSTVTAASSSRTAIPDIEDHNGVVIKRRFKEGDLLSMRSDSLL